MYMYICMYICVYMQCIGYVHICIYIYVCYVFFVFFFWACGSGVLANRAASTNWGCLFCACLSNKSLLLWGLY